MCEEGLHDPFEDQVECARYKAERDALAQAVQAVCERMEVHCLGVEGMDDSPVASWARDLRAALGSLHAPGFQKSRKVASSLTPHSDVSDATMSARDLLPEEEREAIAWVRRRGGIGELSRMFQDADNRRVELCGALDIDLDKGWSEAMTAMRLRLMPEGWSWREVFARLADLIEPACDKGEKDIQPNVTCDREAMLALADEMERKAGDWDATVGDIPMIHAGYLTAYADRIREAYGVAVDG